MADIEKGLNHEDEVLSLISEIEVPLMEALQAEYGQERGWRLCGPASIALSRILSTRVGVPIGRGISGEHLELSVGIFDPKEDPNRLARIEEQTYIRYHLGDNSIYYIDPIYGLLMRSRGELSGAIQVEKYQASNIDHELISRHHLYPFDPDHEGLTANQGWASHETATDRQLCWLDTVHALNDKRGTYSVYMSRMRLGYYTTEWRRTVPIIQRFAPAFTEDLVGLGAELSAVASYVGGTSTSGPEMMPHSHRIMSKSLPIPYLEELEEPILPMIKDPLTDLKKFRIGDIKPRLDMPSINAQTLKLASPDLDKTLSKLKEKPLTILKFPDNFQNYQFDTPSKIEYLRLGSLDYLKKNPPISAQPEVTED